MKKIVSAACAVCFAAALCLFAACAPAEERAVYEGVPSSLEGKVTVAIDDPATAACDYYVQADAAAFGDGATALDVIDHFVAEGSLVYEGSVGEFGMYMTAIGVVEGGEEKIVLREDAAEGRYLSFYTNVEADMQGSGGIDYGGTAVEPSMAGVGSMHVEAGAVIYITYYTYA